MTSRVSAGLRLSKVRPRRRLDPLAADEQAERRDVVPVGVAVGVGWPSSPSQQVLVATRRRVDASVHDASRRPSRPSRRRRGRASPVRSGPARRSQLVEERRDDPGAARPDRVAERDRAAVHVDLVPVEAELAAVGEGLGRERLVDLDEVEGLDRQLDPVEQPADALDRREEQPPRLDLGLRVADDPGQRLQADRSTARSLATTVAAAPSVIPGALPAVTVPVASPRSRVRSAVRQREGGLRACERLGARVAARVLVYRRSSSRGPWRRGR